MSSKYVVNPEWIRQAVVVYGALIAIGVVVLQALIPAKSLDPAALVSIFAFAIAIPFLAVMVLVNHAQAGYRYVSYPGYITIAILLGQGGAFVGVTAAFWHISWIAGLLLLVSGGIGLAIYAAYTKQLEADNAEDASKDTK